MWISNLSKIIINKSTVVSYVFGIITCFLFLNYTPPRQSSVHEHRRYPIKCSTYSKHDVEGHHANESVLADYLKKKVRLFCVILTMPANRESKAIHVKATWAKRFDGYIFISSVEDDELPSIAVVDTESRDVLWNKTRGALIYAFENHLNDYDFFMKADDDTFVIPENLRLILKDLDPNIPMLMGRKFKVYVKQGYCSGGAGYVLSRAALIKVVDGIRRNVSGCVFISGSEDYNLGVCCEALGIKIVESLDEHGVESFHPFSPVYMIDNRSMQATSWIHSFNAHDIVTGVECCSDHSVSFHYVSPDKMYELEYLIYHLYPYGITRDVASYKKALQLLQNERLNS